MIFESDGDYYLNLYYILISSSYSFSDIELSADDFDITSFDVYPNPSDSVINISVFNDTVLDLEVFDILGNKVMSAANTLDAVDLSRVNAGQYFLKIQTERGITVKKIIKK